MISQAPINNVLQLFGNVDQNILGSMKHDTFERFWTEFPDFGNFHIKTLHECAIKMAEKEQNMAIRKYQLYKLG